MDNNNSDLNVIVDKIILNKIVDCCSDWKVNLIICSVKEPHNKLIYIKLNDPHNIIPNLNHVIENNDMVKKLISYFIKSDEELELVSGNTSPKEYRINIAKVLYNLCLGDKENIEKTSIKLL